MILKVWLLKDNTVIVLHGDEGSVSTIDNEKFPIESFEYPVLKEKVALPNGEYIPTLTELIELCKGKLKINIELKGENLELLTKVFEILEKTDMFGSINLSSFYHPFYEKFLDLKEKFNVKEEVGFGFLLWLENETKEFFDNLPKRFYENKNNSINLELTLLIEHKWIRDKVKEFKSKGTIISIYYPFRIKETMQNLLFISELGIDRAICNDPLVIQKFNSFFDY